MITVHHLNNSRSQRILWLLEELGAEYELKRYDRDPVTSLAPASLKQVHPLGKSPVITHDGQTIAESGLIVEYLAQQFDSTLMPTDKTQQIQAKYWLHYAEGSLMPILLNNLILSKIEHNAKPFFIKMVAKKIVTKVNQHFVSPNIQRNFDYIEAHLDENQWFAGDEISIADIQMSFPLEASVARIPSVASRASIAQFVKRIQQRPAYQKALSVGGQYDYV